MNTDELTMSYEGLVEAGRAAREQADSMQWAEGDLAMQVEALPGAARPRDPETGLFIEDETKALRRYADDVGLSHSTLKRYRQVAEAWPVSTRSTSTSWHVHRALVAQEDRFELIRDDMTVREAEGIVRYRRAGNSGKPGWHELLGRVGDSLIAAEKHMTKLEDALGDDQPSDKFSAKAEEYAGWAEALTERLRATA